MQLSVQQSSLPNCLSTLRLRPYQEEGADFVYENDASFILAPMGSGKTAVTATSISELVHDEIVSRVLILAPLRVCQFVWPQEMELWAPQMSLELATGTAAERRKALTSDAKVVVMNYDNVQWAAKEKLLGTFDCLVLDESTKVKSTKSKRWKALRRLLKQFKIRIALTGTPVSQSLMDFYGQVALLDGGKSLGKSFYEFRSRYFVSHDREGWYWEPIPGAEEKILDAIRHLTFMVDPGDYADQLPGITTNQIRFALPQDAMDQYRELRKELVLELQSGSVIEAGSGGALTTKLRCLASGFLYDELGEPHWVHGAKLDAACDVLEELPPTLVFYQYRAELFAMLDRFPGTPYLGAGSSHADAADAIARWNRGELSLMFLHPHSAGHGLNLQSGGSSILWMSLPWSWDKYEQARARLHRSGQRDVVFEQILLADGTMDLVVLNALQNHADVAQRVAESLR